MSSIANREEEGFGGVEGLPGSPLEDRHVVQEGLDVDSVEGPEEGLSVIGVLSSVDLEAGGQLQADDGAGLEPAEEGPGDEEVESRRQRTALSHPRVIFVEGGDKTIDVGRGGGVGEDSGDPFLESWPSPDGLHDTKEEGAIDRIIGLAEVEEGEDPAHRARPKPGIGAEDLRDEVEEGDVVPDEAPFEEGGLLRSDDGVQHPPQPRCQDLGHASVVGVEEGDGAVVGRQAGIPRLEEGGHHPVKEVRRSLPCPANG
jgi:hypothetical protein